MARGCLALAGLCLAACSGGGGSDAPDAGPTPYGPPTAVLTAVTIAVPAAAQAPLVPGQSVQLVATPRDQTGNPISANVTWSSSAPGVASVSSSGLVTAAAPGTTTITATATSGSTVVTGTLAITVQAASPVLAAVAITPATAAMQVGATLQLTATATDQNGNAIAAAITWGTSASAVATVSQTGLVTGVAVGTAVITAEAVAGGRTVSANRTITVSAAAPVLTSVTISAPASTVTVGETLQLTATARDQFGAAIPATFTWSSSNTGRATVSASGLVTGVSAGAVTISVSATTGGASVSGAVGLTIQDPPPVLTSVEISGGSSVTVGATLQLTASPRDQFGNAIAATVSWSSNATGVATVNASTGLVTGVAVGSANITALATMGSATASAFQTITVNAAAFPSAATVNMPGNSFSPSSVDIAVGGTVTWNFPAVTHNVTFAGGAGAPGNIPNTANASVARTFNATGTFNYSCTLHVGMNGTVVVH